MAFYHDCALLHAPLIRPNKLLSVIHLPCMSLNSGRKQKRQGLGFKPRAEVMLTTELGCASRESKPCSLPQPLSESPNRVMERKQRVWQISDVFERNCLLCVVLGVSVWVAVTGVQARGETQMEKQYGTSVNRRASDGSAVYFSLLFSLPVSCYLSNIPAQLCQAQSLVVMGREA